MLMALVQTVAAWHAASASTGNAAPGVATGSPIAELRGPAATTDALTSASIVASASATPCDVWSIRCVDWAAEYSSPFADDLIADMTSSPDGDRVYAVGFGEGGERGEIFAYDASTGAPVWSNLEADLGRAQVLALSPDASSLFVAGWTCRPNWCDFTLGAYATLDGTRRYLTSGTGVHRAPYNAPRAITVSPDGGTVFVTGFGQFQDHETMPGIQNNFVAHIVTIAYDAETGAIRWRQVMRGPLRPTDNTSQPYAIATSPDGATVYVGGHVPVATSVVPARIVDGIILAYDAASGVERWRSGYDADLVNVARAMAVSADGERVYLGGFDRHFQKTPCDNRFCIVDSYFIQGVRTSDGAEIWTHRVPGLGDALSMTVSPIRDRVLLAGYTVDQRGYRFGTGLLAVEGATGARAWLYHDDLQVDSGVVSEVAIAPDGRTAWLAATHSPAASADLGAGFAMHAIGVDVASGASVWDARYPRGIQSMAFAVTALAADRVALGGVYLDADPLAPDGLRQGALTVAWTAVPYEMLETP